MSLDSYEFEDVACNVLRIGPLTSTTWTVEIQPEGWDKWVSVIMTAKDLRALAAAANRIAGPDIQYFAASGTWHKPPGAVRVDCLIQAAGGGGAVWMIGPGHVGADGEAGELHVKSFPADEIPDTIEVEIGRGGRGAEVGGVKAGDGADGYALIITHLEQKP